MTSYNKLHVICKALNEHIDICSLSHKDDSSYCFCFCVKASRMLCGHSTFAEKSKSYACINIIIIIIITYTHTYIISIIIIIIIIITYIHIYVLAFNVSCLVLFLLILHAFKLSHHARISVIFDVRINRAVNRNKTLQDRLKLSTYIIIIYYYYIHTHIHTYIHHFIGSVNE